MVVGFNHNFRYKGEVYHVQTEDSGLKNPHIITLLYKDGTILASKKTSYQDIIKVDNLEQVVEELMKEQHKEMLRRLKEGEFDERLGLSEKAPAAAAAAPAPTPPEAKPQAAAPAAAPPKAATAPPQTSSSPAPAAKAPPGGVSLDDIILSYMVGEDPPNT
ncbi:MAG: hypothetical protein C0621_01500 [Desulfuromonas sp.]|nr:MAG: hypothetical protein C0621_01500 [Desulfuromonas sp.]